VGAQKEKKLWFKANPATEGTPDQKRIFWFRAKEYGWGWYPATWEGWLVLHHGLLSSTYRYSFKL
jgi:predicted GH43/DUF377 family glycosyl hydrolase